MRKLFLCLSVVLLAQMLLLLAGCERRQLEVIVSETVRVKITVKWNVNFIPLYHHTPNGMTVMIWDAAGGAPIVRTTNDDHITVSLKPATYHMIVFNELADDYAPFMHFVDADSYERIAMRATTFTVASTRAWDDGITYMHTPEDPRIAVALDTFEVTKEMVLRDTTILIPYDEYQEGGYADYRESEYVYSIDETPWPMSVDLFVKMRVKHRQSLKAVNGSISGLADGFYLSQIIRTSETGIIRFNPDDWERSKLGDDADSMGIVSTRIATFGLPYGKELLDNRVPSDNVLSLALQLTNDSVVYANFQVGKCIHYITPEGLEAQIRYRQDLQNLQLIINLPDTIFLPPLSPASGTGFDAKVDDWEDGGTWDIGGF